MIILDGFDRGAAAMSNTSEVPGSSGRRVKGAGDTSTAEIVPVASTGTVGGQG